MAAPPPPPPPADQPTPIVDDKSPLCIPFILARLAEHRKRHNGSADVPPLVVGLNGVQGVGKTTLVRALAHTLQEREGLPTLVVSIDDFYLTHADQLALAAAHPTNALVQCRGEPGTHDLPLLTTFLTTLRFTPHEATPIPQYSKSAHSGRGDRLPPSTWPSTSPSSPPQILLLEGWCVGFRPLPPATLQSLWSSPDSRTLRNHALADLEFVNDQLVAYHEVVNHALDAFVHVDAEETDYVYAWREEQEAKLREETGGQGMTREEVERFVDAYYPAYELYTEGVRKGVFEGEEGKGGCQLRIVVGRDRRVVGSEVI
ncbi:P-loop containing nucleoside triphosphate hydrolase protein [Staphylotrichum tortipilum]|uniref:P-loop containing nucleoside triphosphate hydrolase protein n=1 Tax=Staphylotrichum tortipilum TaxID=2831512 RepID=A0AAN6MCM3_9PEZI|nr:P-loop containing nucleoside triphosphate hydrolase protein [Staphylotrichum longicolle]